MEYLSEYIINKHIKDIKDNNPYKIVEIGVGYYFKVAKVLKEYDNRIDLTVVDINRDAIDKAKREGLNALIDDIFNPKLDLYKYANLIYSIRPPRDLQPFILKISKKHNVPLIIKPLYGEPPIGELKLINYNGNAIYVYG